MWRAHATPARDLEAEFALQIADPVAAEKPHLKGMSRHEAAVAIAKTKNTAASHVLADAQKILAAAETALELARENANDKKAKQDALDAAEAAEHDANNAYAAHAVALKDADEAGQQLRRVHGAMLLDYVKRVSSVLADEANDLRSVYTAETLTTASGIADQALRGDGRQAASREAMDAMEYEQAELEEMRRIVDPNYQRDLRRGIERFGDAGHLHAKDWNPATAASGRPFPPAPLAPRFKYPVHGPMLSRGQNVARVAKFRGGDRGLLVDSHGYQRAVQVTAVELADTALAPRATQIEKPEAVYLVREDSTTTTWERGKVEWVNERHLKPRAWGAGGKEGLRGGVGWRRIWPQGISFEQARIYALRETEKQVARQRVEQGVRSGQGNRAGSGCKRAEPYHATHREAPTAPTAHRGPPCRPSSAGVRATSPPGRITRPGSATAFKPSARPSSAMHSRPMRTDGAATAYLGTISGKQKNVEGQNEQKTAQSTGARSISGSKHRPILPLPTRMAARAW